MAKYKEPIYSSHLEAIIVELGTIMGCKVLVELKGDTETKENNYVRVLATLTSVFNPKKED